MARTEIETLLKALNDIKTTGIQTMVGIYSDEIDAQSQIPDGIFITERDMILGCREKGMLKVWDFNKEGILELVLQNRDIPYQKVDGGVVIRSTSKAVKELLWETIQISKEYDEELLDGEGDI